MLKKSISIILICILVCMIGCGNKNTGNTKDGDRRGAAEDASQLPDIVFFNTIMYLEFSGDGIPESAITFYDNQGNHYTSTDEYVCTLPIEKLVREYAEGTLADKISFHTSCDAEELLENYNKLCEVSEDGFKIIYREIGPDVIANLEYWYGLYYDENGNIRCVEIHKRDEHGDHYADDERVNEIYEWYLGTFKK